MVDRVLRDLQGRAAREQADEDLLNSVDAGGEGDRLQIRRQRRELFEPAQISEAMNAAERFLGAGTAAEAATHEPRAGGEQDGDGGERQGMTLREAGPRRTGGRRQPL